MATTSGTATVGMKMSDALAASATRLQGFTVPIEPVNVLTVSNGASGTAGTYAVSSNVGAGPVLANKIYMSSGSAAASPVDIDLATVTNVDGTTGFASVRRIEIYNDATTAAFTLTTGGGTNPFKPYLSGTSPTFAIDPGMPFIAGRILSTAGYTVDASNKVVRLDPGANTVPYRIVVIGN